MAKKAKQPTVGQIEKIAKRMQERCQQRNADIEYRRQLRWREYPVHFGDDEKNPSGIPAMYKRTTVEIHSPIIEYNVQEAVALLSSNQPTTAIRIQNSDNQATATKAERWDAGGRARLEEKTGALAKTRDTQVAYYAGIRKCHPRRKYWEDYPESVEGEDDADYNKRTDKYVKDQNLLAVFEYCHVPIDTFFADPEDSHGIPRCCEVKMVPEKETLEEFGFGRTKDGEYLKTGAGVVEDSNDPSRTCKVIEYWDRTYRVLVVKGAKTAVELDVWEHPFERVPYFKAAAFETGETDEAKRYVPLLWPMYPEVEENNRLHTMRTNVAYQTGFPRWYIANAATQQLALDEKTGEPIVYDFNGPPNQLGPGQTLVQVELHSGFDLQAALRDSDERLRAYALPPVASGKAPSGESSGWNTANLHRFMVSLLGPLVDGLASQEAEIARFKLWCIRHVIGQKVYVNADVMDGKRKTGEEAIALGPDDIDKLGDFDLTIRIDPNLEMDRLPQTQAGWNRVKEGGQSMRQHLEEDCGNEAPEEEMERIDVDKMANRMFEEVFFPQAVAWAQARAAGEGVLGGASAESVMREDEASQATIGKGSPNLPRTPGLRMPAAPPIGVSPTYSPPEQI